VNWTQTEKTLRENFESMLDGVRTSHTLTDEERLYICELLEDQLRTELECLEMTR
jgi:hypothetical protein